jgi:c-di-AMP phosphodiesterase-like protein
MMTNDAILTQLDYTVTDSALAQVDKVKENTKGFDYVVKHLVLLHDQLKSHLSFVALSSNKDYFKVKNEATGVEMIAQVNEIIAKWSEKYKIELEKVSGKDTYYVLGYSN